MDAACYSKFGGKKTLLRSYFYKYFIFNILLFYFFSTFIIYNIPISSKPIAHNVPAVYDVLAARIRALRSKDQGRQNVTEVLRGNERSD
jgi:hypothetical protein